MKNIIRYGAAFSLALLCASSPVVAGTLATGTGVAGTNTFNAASVIGTGPACAFDRANGVWYGGMTTVNAADTGYSLFKVGPSNGTGTQTATALTTGTAVTAATVTNISLSQTLQAQGSAATQRAFFLSGLSAITLYALNTSGTPALVSDATIRDGFGAVVNGAIRAIAATPVYGTVGGNGVAYCFAAVSANGAATWGAANGGIAVASVGTAAAPVITKQDATAGGPGNTARTIVITNAGPYNPRTLDAAAVTAAVINDVTPVLHWDNYLQRLFIGCDVTSGNAAATDAAFSVAVISVGGLGRDANAAGQLTIRKLIADGVNQAGTAVGSCNGLGAAVAGNIVGVKAQNVTLSVIHLNTMRTSTNKSYMIIVGGHGAQAVTGNQVWALPLVDNVGVVAEHGTLANVLDPAFDKQANLASGAGQLYAIGGTIIPATVGGGVLPVAASATAVSKLQVVGDTVYCSVLTTANAGVTEPSIYYSQAQFANDGTIATWTTWEKALPGSSTNIAGTFTNNRVQNFAVDAERGKIWAVPAAASYQVFTTQWYDQAQIAALGTNDPSYQVNRLLNGPCYSVLDLHGLTQDLAAATAQRYTIFGGKGKVAILRMSTASAAAYDGFDVTTADFSTATGTANWADITNSGFTATDDINCLGYSKRVTAATNNFIFAGTNRGLFAFADPTGVGFNLALPLAAVNAAPFSTFTWQAITGITDPVAKIVSCAPGDIYVLTKGYNASTGAAVHRVYHLLSTSVTVTTLNTNAAVIAQTGANTFANANYIYDIEIISDETGGAGLSQLVIATDDGLYVSAIQGGVNVVGITTDALASYVKLSNRIFTSLNAPRKTRNVANRAVQTLFATEKTSEITSVLRQLCFNTNQEITTATGINNGLFAMNPQPNANSDSLNYFTSFDLMSHGGFSPAGLAFSDGAFRFMINRRINDGSNFGKLNVQPYRVGITDYNATALVDIPDAEFLTAETRTAYWCQRIGQGFIMAGTDDGLIELY